VPTWHHAISLMFTTAILPTVARLNILLVGGIRLETQHMGKNRFRTLVVIACGCLLSGVARAEDAKCPKGLQPYGKRCVSQYMSDYVVCVEAAGGNHDEINLEISNAQAGKTSAEAKGAGGNLAVHGEGALALSHDTEAALQKKFREKWGNQGMESCLKALKSGKPAPAAAPGKTVSTPQSKEQPPTTVVQAPELGKTYAAFENAGKADRILVAGNIIEPPPGGTGQAVKNDPTGQMTNVTDVHNEIKAPPTAPTATQECAPGANCALSVGQQRGITANTVNIASPNAIYNFDGSRIRRERGGEHSLNINDPNPAVARINGELSTGKGQQALSESQGLMASDPLWATPHILAGFAYISVGNLDGAKAELRKAKALVPPGYEFEHEYAAHFQRLEESIKRSEPRQP